MGKGFRMMTYCQRLVSVWVIALIAVILTAIIGNVIKYFQIQSKISLLPIELSEANIN